MVLDKPRTLCCQPCRSLAMALGQVGGGALRGEEPVTSAPQGPGFAGAILGVCALPALWALTGQAGVKPGWCQGSSD